MILFLFISNLIYIYLYLLSVIKFLFIYLFLLNVIFKLTLNQYPSKQNEKDEANIPKMGNGCENYRGPAGALWFLQVST